MGRSRKVHTAALRAMVTFANTRQLLYLWNHQAIHRLTNEPISLLFFDRSIDLCRRAGFRKILMQCVQTLLSCVILIDGTVTICSCVRHRCKEEVGRKRVRGRISLFSQQMTPNAPQDRASQPGVGDEKIVEAD